MSKSAKLLIGGIGCFVTAIWGGGWVLGHLDETTKWMENPTVWTIILLAIAGIGLCAAAGGFAEKE